MPAFSTDFDLLTTLDPAQRRRLEKLPFYAIWRRLLRPRTCFVGTTVSEYALFSQNQTPADFINSLLGLTRKHSFIIIKDIPSDSALVGETAHEYNLKLVKACQQAGFVMVEGQALAYVPINFESIDVFLARMSYTRRKNIRRKLRASPHLKIKTLHTGDKAFLDQEVLDEFYGLYRNVYDQSEIHFDLLSTDFFKAVLQDAGSGGVVFCYYSGDALIGYNLCFEHNGMLLDKYVGFAYPQAREQNLYFVSWFHNLEYSLARDLRHYVAGWTDPEVKRDLGASFTFTRHAVYVRNPWLRRMLLPFKRHFEADSNWRATTHH